MNTTSGYLFLAFKIGACSLMILLCIMILYTVNSISCDCFPAVSPLEELKKSDAVFIGTVRSVELFFLCDSSIGRNYWANRVKFKVTGYWKGVTSPDLELYTPAYGPSCGYYFETGEAYLVYAYIWQGELNTNSCTRTREITYAEGDIEELGDPEMFVIVDEGSPVSGTPSYYSLEQNYPNPFNPQTQITYSIAKTTDVKLTIYDLLGQEVATLVNERKPAGTYTVNWNAEGIPTGIYFYRLTAGEFIETKKMAVVK